MKKNDCNIVRDLIPIVIDRVASDESRQIVEEHIANCKECQQQYDEMKAELPAVTRVEYEEEQKKFMETVRAVRKTRLKRRIKAIALALILCAAAAFGGTLAYFYLYTDYSVVVDNKLYSLNLSQLNDGRIVVTIDPFGINFGFGAAHDTYVEAGKEVHHLYAEAARIRLKTDNIVRSKWDMYSFKPEELSKLHEIRQGKPNNYITIWSQGDPIPPASKEMEAYFVLEDQMDAYWQSLPSNNDAGEIAVIDNWNYFDLQTKLEKARDAVPEWK